MFNSGINKEKMNRGIRKGDLGNERVWFATKNVQDCRVASLEEVGLWV